MKKKIERSQSNQLPASTETDQDCVPLLIFQDPNKYGLCIMGLCLSLLKVKLILSSLTSL